MSLVCIFVIENISEKSEMCFFTQQIESLSKYYKRGVKFLVDWSEPIVSHVQKNAFVINILDYPESDNCELFLLPDGWYVNGKTNELKFRERMSFLQDISNVFINRKYSVELYLGQSGTHPEDFYDVSLKNKDLADYLTKTIGVEGVEDGMHISVVL